MIVREIKPGLWYVAAAEPDRRVFGRQSFSERGVMFGTYLLDTGEGWSLFGSIPERHIAGWLDEIEQIVSGDIKWYTVFGTEYDRAAARAVLTKWQGITLIGSMAALFVLNVEICRKIEVRLTRKIVLGTRVLEYRVIPAKSEIPSLYVFDEASGAMLTADAFGSVLASESVLLSEVSEPGEFYRGVERHLEDIDASNRREIIENAAEFVRESGAAIICPAQGPVIDEGIDRVLEFMTRKPVALCPALAVVHSSGRYLGEIAEKIAEGSRESGLESVEVIDLGAVSRDVALKKLMSAENIVIGTSEQHRDASKVVWDILTSLSPGTMNGRQAAVFTTIGSETVAELLRFRMDALGYDKNLRNHYFPRLPLEEDFKAAGEYGFDIGCLVQRIPNPRRRRLVKCLVCGEIFDSSLGICPVCGVGLDQCVPVDEDTAAYHYDTDQSYLILGGGIAAVSAAQAIRGRDKTGKITLIYAEEGLPINRPMLTKNLDLAAGDEPELYIHGAEWYEEQGFILRPGLKAVTVDAYTKTVLLDNDEKIVYSKLIFATGAECFVPPFKGADKDGVLTIRHAEDGAKLAKLIVPGRSAVVIGGGALGLEAASELMRAGVKVTVLEAAPQIIGRQVDTETAEFVKKSMEALHVPCFEGVSIEEIEGEEHVSGVRLADGTVFPADFVVVSCGNRANVDAAKSAGLMVERAIVADDRMRTNIPDIYACGDCAQLDGVNFQLWQEAAGQGTAAGANAAGDDIRYANIAPALSFEGFGQSLIAVGDPGKGNLPYKTVEIRDNVGNRRETYWFYGGSLQGAVVVNKPEKTVEVTRAVATKARYDELFG